MCRRAKRFCASISPGPGSWRLLHFCRVDRQVQGQALQFMRRLKAGRLDAARALSVDAYFPRRQMQQFPRQRLQQLQARLQRLPEPQAETLVLNQGFDYSQRVSLGEQRWQVSLRHADTQTPDCRFFVMEIQPEG